MGNRNKIENRQDRDFTCFSCSVKIQICHMMPSNSFHIKKGQMRYHINRNDHLFEVLLYDVSKSLTNTVEEEICMYEKYQEYPVIPEEKL